jgi:hypothetical protein
MKSSEFIALLTAYTNNTTNIRAFNRPWEISSEQTLATIANNIGRVVSLLQDHVNHNVFCKKNEECLLIYNGEEVSTSTTTTLYWTLNIIIKPLADIDTTSSLTGKSLQLIINDTTGEVMNLSKGMLDTQLTTSKDTDWEGENAPISYGYYHAYRAPCCFVAISSYRSFKNLDEMFQGKYDKGMGVQQSRAFDTFLEASDFLAKTAEPGKYIAELPHPKEQLEYFKKSGLGKEMRMIIDETDHSVIAAPSSSLDTHQLSSLNEELGRFKTAFGVSMRETETEFKASMVKSAAALTS